MAEWLQIVLRTLAVVAVLFGTIRLLGKKQLAQLSSFEYVIGIMMGGIGAITAFGFSIQSWYLGFYALIVCALSVILLNVLQLKSKKIRDWIVGKGTVLIKDGKIMEDNLKQVKFSSDDLLQQLRKKNAFAISDVEFAVLETSGDVSVMLKKENMPLTPKMLGVTVANGPEPQTVIMDGEIMDEPLATLRKSRQWLMTELEKLGVAIENVYLGQVNSYGELFVDLFDDKLTLPQPQPRKEVEALLKKCAADMELFALGTDNTTAKAMYEQCSKDMAGMVENLRPYLRD